MNMGRERGILRWDIHYSLLTARLAQIEETLAGMSEPKGPRERERLEQIQRDQADALARIQALGPSPRAKMG